MHVPSYTDSKVVAFNLATDSLSARSEHKNCIVFLMTQTTAVECMRMFVYACAFYSERQSGRREQLSINITGHKLQKDGSYCLIFYGTEGEIKLKDV